MAAPRVILAIGLALATARPALAADLPVQPPPAATSAPIPEPPTPAPGSFAPPDAACLEWTDGCRTCQRAPAGEAACSNVGIACVPQALRCSRR
jgi:hypothetical protein